MWDASMALPGLGRACRHAEDIGSFGLETRPCSNSAIGTLDKNGNVSLFSPDAYIRRHRSVSGWLDCLWGNVTSSFVFPSRSRRAMKGRGDEHAIESCVHVVKLFSLSFELCPAMFDTNIWDMRSLPLGSIGSSKKIGIILSTRGWR